MLINEVLIIVDSENFSIRRNINNIRYFKVSFNNIAVSVFRLTIFIKSNSGVPSDFGTNIIMEAMIAPIPKKPNFAIIAPIGLVAGIREEANINTVNNRKKPPASFWS